MTTIMEDLGLKTVFSVDCGNEHFLYEVETTKQLLLSSSTIYLEDLGPI